MMVAFRYDNGAVGSLYYSREIPSLLQGPAAVEDVRPRRRHHLRVERAVRARARPRASARLRLPGVPRHPRLPARCTAISLASIRDGRAPEMSLERAMDDQRLMDQIYATLGTVRAVNPHYDIIIIGSGAGGGTMAARAGGDRRADPAPRARRLRAAGGRELGSRARSGSDLRYRTRERWLDERGREFRPYTHYNVGGNTKFWGSVLYRLRREDFEEVPHADGVSPAWPIDYDTLAPYYERAERLYQVHGEVGDDPTEPPRGPYPYPPVPHAAAWREIVARLRALGLHPSPLPLGLIGPGEPGGCILCNTCNSFPCRIHAKSEAEVVRASAGARRRPNVDALDQRAARRRLITDAQRHAGRPASRSSATAHVDTRPGADRRRLVRRGEFGGAAAAVGGDRASGRPRQLVGPRRPPLHGAPGDDDAGVPPVAEERDGLPEDRRDQRLLLRGPGTPYPLGQIQSQGRTHGVMAQTRRASRIPLWAYDAWVARGVDWLAMTEDLPDPDNRVTVDAGRAHPCSSTARTTCARTRQLVAETRADPAAARVLDRRSRTRTGRSNTTHQCGTLVFGTDPARVGARSVLPHPRRREPVRRRRVVLPLVGRGEPGADDRRAGAARGRSHHARTT